MIKGLLLAALIFNVLIGVTFVTTSLSMWSWLNNDWNYIRNRWSPLEVFAVRYYQLPDGKPVTIGTAYVPIPNFPFILFWVSTIGNMLIIAIISKVYWNKSKPNAQQ